MVHFRFLFEYERSAAIRVSLSASTDVPHGTDLRRAMAELWYSLQRAHTSISHIPYAKVRVYLQAVKGIYVIAKDPLELAV